MAVELRHLRSFVAVAEEANIGRAAQRLFITQPALSRQMQQLERAVGAPLLLRTARGVELTEAGGELLVRARVALDAVDDALAVGRAQEPRGKLLLGVPLAGGRARWFGLVQAYLERHPAVEVEVREALSEPLQRQVLAGELDAAFVLAPARQPGLAYTHVLDERVWAWMAPEHPLAEQDEIALADLHGRDVTLLAGPAGTGSGFNAAIQELFTGTGVAPRFTDNVEMYPPHDARRPGFLGLTVPLDFGDPIVRRPLVPRCTMPFFCVHRADVNRAAVHALGPFAAVHLAAVAPPCADGMPVA